MSWEITERFLIPFESFILIHTADGFASFAQPFCGAVCGYPSRKNDAGLPAACVRVIASDRLGWEHVSVSLPTRTPNWREMCFIKNLFWDEKGAGIQYHPAKSEYVNNHENCLHLWRPVGQETPTPPKELVEYSS